MQTKTIKKTALVMLFLFMILNVYAGSIRLPTPEYKETEIPQGQNGQAALFPYTRLYIKLYEGSRLDFSIFDPQTTQPIVNNSIIIEKVNKDSTIKAKLAIESGPYQDSIIKIGQRDQIQLNFTTKQAPFMFLQNSKTRYIDGAKDNYVVLYLNVPMFSVVKEPKTQPQTIDTTKPTGIGAQEETSYIPYLLIVGVVLLIIAIMAYTRTGKETEEEKTEDKPKKKKSPKK